MFKRSKGPSLVYCKMEKAWGNWETRGFYNACLKKNALTHIARAPCHSLCYSVSCCSHACIVTLQLVWGAVIHRRVCMCASQILPRLLASSIIEYRCIIVLCIFRLSLQHTTHLLVAADLCCRLCNCFGTCLHVSSRSLNIHTKETCTFNSALCAQYVEREGRNNI